MSLLTVPFHCFSPKNDIFVASLPPIIMTTNENNEYLNRPYICQGNILILEILPFSAENCWSCWWEKPTYVTGFPAYTKLSNHLIFFVQLAIRKLIFFKHLENSHLGDHNVLRDLSHGAGMMKRSLLNSVDVAELLIVDHWGSWNHHFNAECIVNIFACFSWILPHCFQCAVVLLHKSHELATTTWAQRPTVDGPNHASEMQPSRVVSLASKVQLGIFNMYLDLAMKRYIMIMRWNDNEYDSQWDDRVRHVISYPFMSCPTLHPKLPWLWLCHWCQPGGEKKRIITKAWGLIVRFTWYTSLKKLHTKRLI